MARAAKTREVGFSSVDKEYFPSGFTKGEMLRYYLEIAPVLLPHLRDRPITLIRFPEGVTGQSFYEKNAPAHAPDWIATFDVPRRHHEGHIHYILVNDVETLAWCANLGAIEFHPFLHRVPELEQPTQIAFDLDPGEGADLFTCITVARELREIFGGLGLQAFPKVSGSKGLQLYVPLNTPVTYAAAQPFARSVAELMERRHPQLVVSDMKKELRRGKVLIDWSQNSEAKTTVAVYSLRGKREAPFVSTPVTWDELERAAKKRDRAALDFSPDDVRRRVDRRGDLFAPVLELQQELPAAFRDLMKTRSTSSPRRAAPAAPRSTQVRASLSRYQAKRDFQRTAEPRGSSKVAGGGEALRFVIQKHAARNLHYDFRLEMDGTLKSWAVPKGPPYELGVKRAAFEVEDHPLEYMNFEGTIPQGQYGGGTVMVWDIGTYELLGGSHAKGDLKLRLHGKKLLGEWHIFRIKKEESKPVWLLVKSGTPATAVTPTQDDRSVLTRRSMARIASDNDAQWNSGGKAETRGKEERRSGGSGGSSKRGAKAKTRKRSPRKRVRAAAG